MHERKTWCAGSAIAVLLLFGAAALAVAAEQAQIALPSSATAAPAAGTGAKLDFDSPPPGEKSPITGKLSGVDKPTDYKLLILVSNKTHNYHDGKPQPTLPAGRTIREPSSTDKSFRLREPRRLANSSIDGFRQN